MDWTKYSRNAIPGETVHFYPGGRKDETPFVATVTAAHGQVLELSVLRPGHSRLQCINSVRHMNDPHWKKYPGQKVKDGAWDFHPVFGGITNAQIIRVDAAAKRAQQVADEKDRMTAEEFEAIEALGRLGPYITKIAEDVEIHHEQLKKMPKFMEEFTRQKDELRKQKSSKKVSA